MCSNCSGNYENPDATANLCECGHDVELHDSLGCQVVSLTFRCKCVRRANELTGNRTATSIMVMREQAAINIASWFPSRMRHAIDTETFRCSCGASMCFKCGGCSDNCSHKTGG